MEVDGESGDDADVEVNTIDEKSDETDEEPIIIDLSKSNNNDKKSSKRKTKAGSKLKSNASSKPTPTQHKKPRGTLGPRKQGK